MKEETFKQMLADLIEQEEKRLQVNSEEFNRKHRELVEMLDKIQKKG